MNEKFSSYLKGKIPFLIDAIRFFIDPAGTLICMAIWIWKTKIEIVCV